VKDVKPVPITPTRTRARRGPRCNGSHPSQQAADLRLDPNEAVMNDCTDDQAQEPRSGGLRNGNQSGPPFGPDWPGRRCGAKTRNGTRCLNPGMRNGRCRVHGGLSTGPRTPQGLERSRRARWVHGERSQETRVRHRHLRLIRKLLRGGPREVAMAARLWEMIRVQSAEKAD
jgi:hypothetical protein